MQQLEKNYDEYECTWMEKHATVIIILSIKNDSIIYSE